MIAAPTGRGRIRRWPAHEDRASPPAYAFTPAHLKDSTSRAILAYWRRGLRLACAQRISRLVLVLLAVGCGARTALDQPCLIPLSRVKPAVVFLVQWNAYCDNTDGDCPPDDLFHGRDLAQVVRFTLSQLIPQLDTIALIGAMPTQTISISDRIDDLPDGGWNPAWCATPSALAVPIGAFHGASIQEYFSVGRWPARSPNGQGTVLPNLPVVEDALLSQGTAATRRLVILIDSGRRGCPGLADSSSTITDANYRQIRELFAQLTSSGLRTLVVGMRSVGASGVPDLTSEARLNAEAEGGGLARHDDSEHPVRFYDYANTRVLTSIIHDQVVVPYYCTLYASTAVNPEEATLHLSGMTTSVPQRSAAP